MSGRYCLIELMGQGRAVGCVTDHPGGGFYVEELRPASRGFAARYYLGPCAIYRMHDVTEDVARATVDSGRVSATTLPSWACKGITTPAPLPPPKPLPTLTVTWLHATFRIPRRFGVVDHRRHRQRLRARGKPVHPRDTPSQVA